MHGHDARTETLRKAIDQLRRQGDFRHQHQRLAALRNGGRDDTQIHFGLAAAGHAVQEMRGEAVRCPSRFGEDGGDALCLGFGERHFAGT